METVTQGVADLTALAEEKKGVIEQFAETLPQKAVGWGIRGFLTLVCLFVGRILINVVRKLSRNALNRVGVDKGVVQFVDSFLSIILWIVVIMSVAVNYGVDAASVVAILGSVGLAIGLSLQGALSNFAGGLLILMLRPFIIGDYIRENATGNEGIVTEINVFYTNLRTRDNRVVVVPNGKLADTSLINFTKLDKRQIDLTVSIAYSADLAMAKKVSEEIIRADERVLPEEPVQIFVSSLGESSVNLGLRCWVKTSDYWETLWSLTEAVKLAFDKNGIEIPFNQLDVHMK